MDPNDPDFERDLQQCRLISDRQQLRDGHTRYLSAIELRRLKGIQADPDFNA